MGFPSQFPSVSMVDWNSGQPNARYWVLKLIRDNFEPGDKLVSAVANSPYVDVQGFIKPDGQRKILLVNKRDREFEVSFAGVEAGEVSFVDQTTGFQPPASGHLSSGRLTLRGFGVAVVTLPK